MLKIPSNNQQLSLIIDQNINTGSDIKIKNISIFIKNKTTKKDNNVIQIQNRRFLGNKYKLLNFIEHVVREKSDKFESFCDIFSGTGVVSNHFNNKNIKVISNDLLYSNYIPLKAFLGSKSINREQIEDKLSILNDLNTNNDNYFSKHYGGTYFTLNNARKIGLVRETIEEISENNEERAILLTSLIYAVDKVANTVGHYDAFRKKLDSIDGIKLLIPEINPQNNLNNEIYNEDANILIRKISADVLYIDPPYNSRQYCDTYHLLENLVKWEKPVVEGVAKKMDRSKLKSAYCLSKAPAAFADLIENAKCKHIFVSYNNTGEKMNGRSNARINDEEMFNILKSKGKTEVFEHDYKAFTTGKTDGNGHTERLFYCKVK